MSAHQGSYACHITVDPSTADVLRLEAKKVLMFNHDPFEDLIDYTPAQQLRLANVFRDAFAVIDTLSWNPDTGPQQDHIDVPFTFGHIRQLHRRRQDLLDSNLDLLDDIGADPHHNATIITEIHHNRHAVEALTKIFNTYNNTITT